MAAINQNLEVRKDKDIKVFTEQMENAAKQLAAKLPDVQESSKNEAERLVKKRSYVENSKLGRSVKFLEQSILVPLFLKTDKFLAALISQAI